MITLLTLSILCLISIPILWVVLVLLSVPIALFWALLPWLLRLSAVVLFIRALMDRPFQAESLLPAAMAFGLSRVLR